MSSLEEVSMMFLSVVSSLLCFQISITSNCFIVNHYLTTSSVLISIMWVYFYVRQALYIIIFNPHKDSAGAECLLLHRLLHHPCWYRESSFGSGQWLMQRLRADQSSKKK